MMEHYRKIFRLCATKNVTDQLQKFKLPVVTLRELQ